MCFCVTCCTQGRTLEQKQTLPYGRKIFPLHWSVLILISVHQMKGFNLTLVLVSNHDFIFHKHNCVIFINFDKVLNGYFHKILLWCLTLWKKATCAAGVAVVIWLQWKPSVAVEIALQRGWWWQCVCSLNRFPQLFWSVNG